MEDLITCLSSLRFRTQFVSWESFASLVIFRNVDISFIPERSSNDAALELTGITSNSCQLAVSSFTDKLLLVLQENFFRNSFTSVRLIEELFIHWMCLLEPEIFPLSYICICCKREKAIETNQLISSVQSQI